MKLLKLTLLVVIGFAGQQVYGSPIEEGKKRLPAAAAVATK